MGGALVQLAAYGSQDVYLTTNPQITYFKSVYKRYTNFAMESIYQIIEGNINFGGNINLVVSRNGDLIGSVLLQVSLFDPKDYVLGAETFDYCGWIQGVGNYLVNNVSINIGGQLIDQQYGKWMDIWSELNLSSTQLDGYGTMVGKDYSSATWQPYNTSNEPYNALQIPLQFWFCRNPGLAIPLIALQYHELKIQLQFEKFVNLVVGVKNGVYQKIVQNTNKVLPSFSNTFTVWNNYYFLDTTERRQFAQNAHEYLVEQIQTQTGNLISLKEPNFIRLNLNHPCKEIVLVLNRNNSNAPQNDFSIGNNIISNGTPAQFAPLSLFKLILNGTDRFKERPGEYFRLFQNYTHHTRIPGNYIYTYSFALRPEEHQPSGTCNFTRIDTSQLFITLRNTDDPAPKPIQNYIDLPMYSLYAPSYNILRIMGGMGGLAYSN
uniref:Major capsid protein N-terminal domain-containing protein n=1 Tax=viral metagenome TaxID=1070528 RepID=A0A6C0IA01_9ZZZZ